LGILALPEKCKFCWGFVPFRKNINYVGDSYPSGKYSVGDSLPFGEMKFCWGFLSGKIYEFCWGF
jgi:hypothetical protein